MRVFFAIALLVPFVFLSACSSNSSQLSDFIDQSALQVSSQDGQGFRHYVLANQELEDEFLSASQVEVLHVYIEGDGRPYLLAGEYVATDPTPTRLPALELMSIDKEAAIFLGRPCYFIWSDNCNPDVWTTARYSEDVVRSQLFALNVLIEKYKVKKVRLFGYSGGGSLVVLMAPYLEQLDALVTIAGNLDTDAWVQLHGYQPLLASLNPMSQLSQVSIRQLHLVGKLDKNIPPVLVDRYAREHGGELRVVETFDHDCCWASIWPEILAEF